MRIFVIRHGETPANREGKLSGWTDDPLNENGIRLAAVTGKNIKGIHFDGCYSSPLQRARDTAEIVLRESGNESVPIVTDERLKEIFVGDWEGVKFRPGECEADPEAIMRYFRNPLDFEGCPNGETTEQVCRRTQEFLNELIAKDDGKTYLVSTHGFAVRAMLNFLFEDPSDFWQGHMPYNCCISIIEAEHGNAKLTDIDKVYYDRDDVVDHYAAF